MYNIQWQVIFLLCLLYFLQGIPYGVQMRSLPIYFFDVLNYDIKTITYMNLLMLPWCLLKPILVCFIDIKDYGFSLLYLSLAAKATLNFGLSYLILDTNSLDLVSLSLFLINCLTVIFDVATDQIILVSAKSVTDVKFWGISNAIQIVAYKFGAVFSV